MSTSSSWPREAARRLAGDAAGRIVRPGGEAPLAPSIVGIALDHAAVLVGDDSDRAQMVGVEIASGDAVVAVQHAHAHQGAAGGEEVVPLRSARGEQFGMDAERLEIIGRALRRLLLDGLRRGLTGPNAPRTRLNKCTPTSILRYRRNAGLLEVNVINYEKVLRNASNISTRAYIPYTALVELPTIE
jgi:hypothetical protein